MFHHEARAPVDHNLLVDLRYGNSRGTGGFERCDFESQARSGPRCMQQFQHPAVPPFEHLGFPALADEPQATG